MLDAGSGKGRRRGFGTDLVAAVLVEDDQEDGHDDDDADHDDGVEDGVEEAAAHRVRVFSEGGVNPAAESSTEGRRGGGGALGVEGWRFFFEGWGVMLQEGGGTYSCWSLFSE